MCKYQYFLMYGTSALASLFSTWRLWPSLMRQCYQHFIQLIWSVFWKYFQNLPGIFYQLENVSLFSKTHGNHVQIVRTWRVNYNSRLSADKAWLNSSYNQGYIKQAQESRQQGDWLQTHKEADSEQVCVDGQNSVVDIHHPHKVPWIISYGVFIWIVEYDYYQLFIHSVIFIDCVVTVF